MNDATPPHSHLPYVDTQTAAFIDDPNALLGRGADRLAIARGSMGGTELLSYDLVRPCFRDKRFGNRSGAFYAQRGASPLIMEFIRDGNFNQMDPPDHARMRAILVKGFTPPRVERARNTIDDLANELIDRMAPLGRANFVSEFAHHFSIGVVAAFIGIPREDVALFDRSTIELRLLGQVPMAPGIPRLEAALTALRDYSRGLVARKREKPGDDFISDLIRLQQEGSSLSENELVWSIAGILLAGHDTTRYQMAGCVRAVLEAGIWEQLAAEPQRVPAAVNEGMRIYGATPRQVKVLVEDMTIGGERFAAGDVIIPNMTAAGRDPVAFPDPDKLDLDRPEPLYDIGFGYGTHYCLGHALAKAELHDGMTLLTQRLTDVAIDGPMQMKPTGVIAGLEQLPLRYSARA
jgi:cytochrome P450